MKCCKPYQINETSYVIKQDILVHLTVLWKYTAKKSKVLSKKEWCDSPFFNRFYLESLWLILSGSLKIKSVHIIYKLFDNENVYTWKVKNTFMWV